MKCLGSTEMAIEPKEETEEIRSCLRDLFSVVMIACKPHIHVQSTPVGEHDFDRFKA